MYLERIVWILGWKDVSSHIKLIDQEDELVWSQNLVGGMYTPKLGYKVIMEIETE